MLFERNITTGSIVLFEKILLLFLKDLSQNILLLKRKRLPADLNVNSALLRA